MTIGNRAAEAILKTAIDKGIDFKDECARMDITPKALSDWKVGKCDPCAYYLKIMCLSGYDIIYILTGEKK